MSVTGTTANKLLISSEITAYLNSFVPGQAMYRTQITSIANSNGADDAILTTPVANVLPTAYQLIRPGFINVW